MADSRIGANTIDEILSEPRTWEQCLSGLASSGQLQRLNENLPDNVEFAFIGCGSSFYLAQAASATWSILTGANSRAMPASEILLFPKLLPKPCQPVLISRSGHTSEVLDAAKYLELRQNIRTLAITCGDQTPLEKACTHVIRLSPADEKSTVMTRSFTSMLLALQSFAAQRGKRPDFLKALQSLPAQTERFLPEAHSVIRSLVESNVFADYVFLGQGPF
ncbi:MAG: SIS domain-containing protein, partial [Blastocatellia bacterium]